MIYYKVYVAKNNSLSDKSQHEEYSGIIHKSWSAANAEEHIAATKCKGYYTYIQEIENTVNH